jgi:ATP-dependent DNA helicase RecQ
VVLKVLSGVARTRGRFGKTVVAQMLKGSGAEKMDRWGLKSLSTYGILSDFTQPELTQILDALTTAGYVESNDVDRFRPIVALTEAGWELLKSRPGTPIDLDLPDSLLSKLRFGGLERRPASATSPAAPALDTAESPSPLEDDPLYARLRSLRTAWAREAKQPAYCIFTNETLDDLVRTRPGSPGALAAVKGLGPSRLERYGTALLEAIAGCPAGAPAPLPEGFDDFEPPALPPSRPADRPAPSYVPTEEWTWRLIDRGFSLDEAAAIRGLDRAAVSRHLALVARQGKPVRAESFLDPETLGRWRAWHAERGGAEPPPGCESPELWNLFLACPADRSVQDAPGA